MPALPSTRDGNKPVLHQTPSAASLHRQLWPPHLFRPSPPFCSAFQRGGPLRVLGPPVGCCPAPPWRRLAGPPRPSAASPALPGAHTAHSWLPVHARTHARTYARKQASRQASKQRPTTWTLAQTDDASCEVLLLRVASLHSTLTASDSSETAAHCFRQSSPLLP